MQTLARLAIDHHAGRPVDAYNCACELFEIGYDAPVLQTMVTKGKLAFIDEEQFQSLLRLVDRTELADPAHIRNVEEGIYNREYLDGNLPGRELIQRCFDLYCGNADTDYESYAFWCAIADDSDLHGGECCIEYPFDTNDFDTVLRNAIELKRRPIAE